ncbi:uncharacterized protein LOC130754429 [Actinidia eriantha]|uniref:uncharacterized protein LOC130754429 n=1 Tax=Actinidia eriantha TaxID=165200 RepID=UPI002583D7FB|nr:uncharacterized protein LOC130754429 [Actinidia eriantha]
MDKSEYQNLHSLIQFITSQSLVKITQLLVSVSVFSIFILYSSWHSFFFHSFKFYSIDKNCSFLICNGILVFLAKTSGLIRFSPSSDLNQQLLEKIGDGYEDNLRSTSLETNEAFLEKEDSLENTMPLENIAVEEEEDQEESKFSMERESKESNLIVEDEEQESPSGLLKITSGDEESEKELGTVEFPINEDDDNEEEEENMLLSTEELNKKFDEFIRRMKEEIRIGAQQQQLIMVH